MIKINLWLLALLVFEILLISVSFSLCLTIYNFTFLETVNLIGNIFSIQGVIFGIIFLMFQNKQSVEMGEHIIAIRRIVTE